MKIVVTHSSKFDFVNKLYKPLEDSALWGEHEFVLPQPDGQKEQMTRDIIASADLVLAEVSMPSTGQGVELGWADMSGTRIICVHEVNSLASSSLKYISDDFIEYTDSKDMIAKLSNIIESMRKDSFV